MKRLLVCSAIVAAALLLPAAASALTGPLHARPASQAAGPATVLTAPREAPERDPMLGVITGAATVRCNVYTYYGEPETADLFAYVWGDTDYGYAEAGTVGGVATLTGLPVADADNGEIVVVPTSGTVLYDLWGLSWPADGTEMGLQPGRVPVSISRSADPYYNTWPSAWVELAAVETNGVHFAGTDIAQAGATTSGHAATITLGPETLDWGAIYYWANEGAELSVDGMGVSSGATYPGTIAAREADAHAVWLPGWASGKPGTVTQLWFERFPEGWTNAIRAQASFPAGAPVKSFGSFTTSGAEYQSRKLTIPSTVKPGYAYSFDVAHAGGPLVLSTWFQTCSLAATKTTISRGGAVRLSGVIPTQGHEGAAPGKSKTLVLYKRTKTAGQPRYWDATRSGWTRVGTLKADGFGKYRTSLLRPQRTTWYVVRYPGDDWYWGAFTSVRKVTVR